MGAGDPPPFLSAPRPSHASGGTADVAAMSTSSMAGRAAPVNERLQFDHVHLARMHAHRAAVGATAPTPCRPGL